MAKKTIEVIISTFLFYKGKICFPDAQKLAKELLKYLDDCNLEIKFKE